MALALVDHLGAAMGAAVEQHLHAAVAVAAHDHRLAAELGGDVVAGLRHLAGMPDEQPGAAEDALHLELEHIRDRCRRADGRVPARSGLAMSSACPLRMTPGARRLYSAGLMGVALHVHVDEVERRGRLLQHAPALEPVIGALHLVERDRRGIADHEPALAQVLDLRAPRSRDRSCRDSR